MRNRNYFLDAEWNGEDFSSVENAMEPGDRISVHALHFNLDNMQAVKPVLPKLENRIVTKQHSSNINNKHKI